MLREGNSDRRAPAAVKNYARKHPHSMGAWSPDSKTNVATMGIDDFRDNEQSVVLGGDDILTIQHVATDGTATVLKQSLPVLEGEVVDATVLQRGIACTRSCATRSPAPRPTTCSSRCTSRPR